MGANPIILDNVFRRFQCLIVTTSIVIDQATVIAKVNSLGRMPHMIASYVVARASPAACKYEQSNNTSKKPTNKPVISRHLWFGALS